MKSKDEEISKLVMNRDSRLCVKWGLLILTGFSGCRGQRMLVLGCVRDGSLRAACKSGRRVSDVGREPTGGDCLRQHLGDLGGEGRGENYHLLRSTMCSIPHTHSRRSQLPCVVPSIIPKFQRRNF